MKISTNKFSTHKRAIGALTVTAAIASAFAVAPSALAFQPANDLFDQNDANGGVLMMFGRDVNHGAAIGKLQDTWSDGKMHFCVNAGVPFPDVLQPANGNYPLSEYRHAADSVPEARPYRLNDAAFAYLADRANRLGLQAAAKDRATSMLQALTHLNLEHDSIRMNWNKDGQELTPEQRIQMIVREMEGQHPGNAEELRNFVSTLNELFPDDATVSKGTVTDQGDLTATLTDYGVRTASGKMAYVYDGYDPDITVSLEGPAAFDDGSTSKTVKASQAGALKIDYSNEGTVNYTVTEKKPTINFSEHGIVGTWPHRDQRLITFNVGTEDANASGSFEATNTPKPNTLVKIGTTATDKSDGDKVLLANQSEATITDTVKVSNSGYLKQGDKAVLRGQAVRTADGTPVGEPVCKVITIPHEFSAFEENVDLKIPTMGLHEKQVTVFERLYSRDSVDCANPGEDKLVATHEDRADKGQTLDVKHEGEIKTTAYNEVDNTKSITSDKDQTILDRIDISKSNLQPGKVYKVTAQPVIPWFNGAPSGEPVAFDKLGKIDKMTPTIDSNNQKVVALPFGSAKVVNDSAVAKDAIREDGSIGDVTLKDDEFVYRDGMDHVDVVVSGVDMTNFRPRQKVVMFEKIVSDDITPLVHADINDESQTVKIAPMMKTNLFRVDGNDTVKSYTPGEKTELVDKVQARGLESNKTYLVKLELMTPTTDNELDKRDGIEDGMTPYLDKDGHAVVVDQEINVNKTNVDYNMKAEFVASDQHVTITAYETLTDKDNPEYVLTHKDPKDQDQTIIPMKKTAPVLAKTGAAGSMGILFSMFGLVSAGGAFTFVSRKRFI